MSLYDIFPRETPHGIPYIIVRACAARHVTHDPSMSRAFVHYKETMVKHTNPKEGCTDTAHKVPSGTIKRLVMRPENVSLSV